MGGTDDTLAEVARVETVVRRHLRDGEMRSVTSVAGVKFTDTFVIQTQAASVSWASPTTMKPIGDLRVVQALAAGNDEAALRHAAERPGAHAGNGDQRVADELGLLPAGARGPLAPSRRRRGVAALPHQLPRA